MSRSVGGKFKGISQEESPQKPEILITALWNAESVPYAGGEMSEFVSVKNDIKIGVFGIGCGGGNILNHIIEAGIKGVDFYSINTDRLSLGLSLAPNKVQIGASLTGGFGCGDDPEIGRRACEETQEKIREVACGIDLAFLIASLGGGTGTGASPVVAKVLKESGALVAAIVTKPFRYEGEVKLRRALRGLQELRGYTDSRTVIANDSIIEHYGGRFFGDAFRCIDTVITEAVKGVVDLILAPQIVNIGFADLRAVLSEKGLSVMSVGVGIGGNRAREAAEQVLASPLLDSGDLRGAKRALISVSGDEKLTMKEVDVACSIISERFGDKTLIRCGYGKDKGFKDRLKVTVVASGMEERIENYLDLDGIIRELKGGKPEKIDPEDRSIPAFLRLRRKTD